MGFFRDFWKKGDGTASFAYHSGSYHSFFEGYTEQRLTDPKTGKTRIQRVYSAEYLRCKCTDRQWLYCKILTVALYLAALLVFLAGSYIMSVNCSSKYMEVIPAAGFVVFFYLLYVLVKFLIAPRRMTIGEYKAYTPLLYKTALVVAVIAFFSALCSLINLMVVLMAQAAFRSGFVMAALLFVVSGGLLVMMYRFHEQTEYEHLVNENLDAPGVMIRE